MDKPDCNKCVWRRELGAISHLEKIGVSQYQIYFVEMGFGNAVVETNFKIEAY